MTREDIIGPTLPDSPCKPDADHVDAEGVSASC